MAHYTITHACGHKDTIALFGPHAARDKRIEHMENELCPACWAEKSRNADVSHGLPALKGSDKQVAWASEIRQEVLPG
ncbi:MAG: hypothetical protein LBE32_05675, partial [Burkholderiales bacterium]|nr:hypothetical protein [Burkholderiales bacterium]